MKEKQQKQKNNVLEYPLLSYIVNEIFLELTGIAPFFSIGYFGFHSLNVAFVLSIAIILAISIFLIVKNNIALAQCLKITVDSNKKCQDLTKENIKLKIEKESLEAALKTTEDFKTNLKN